MLSPKPGGPRQPLDRQLRYYSEAIRLASLLKWHPEAREPGTRDPRNNMRENQRIGGRGLDAPNAARVGAAFWDLTQATGLPRIVAGGFSTGPTAGFPGRLSLFEGRFVSGCSCRGLLFLAVPSSEAAGSSLALT